MKVPQYPTTGALADAAGLPIHCVEWFIKSRRIVPAGRAGIANVYGEDDARRILEAMTALRARREGRVTNDNR